MRPYEVPGTLGGPVAEPPPQTVGPVPEADYPGPLDTETIAVIPAPHRRTPRRPHGLRSACFSRSERRKMNALYRRFRDDLKPVGAIEEALVAKLAATSLRMECCARAERQYHRWTWPRPSRALGEFDNEAFSEMVCLVSRYDTALTNQFLKLLRELARCQERRAAHAKNADSAETDARPSGIRS